MTDGFVIVKGGEYLYNSAIPPGCKGHRYRVLGFPREEPAGQVKVLVEALTGPHAGRAFTVTQNNFWTRYVYAPVISPEEAPVPVGAIVEAPAHEKVLDLREKGGGA